MLPGAPAGNAPAPRLHHFCWSCPIAQCKWWICCTTRPNAARRTDAGCRIQRHHVWLLESPGPAPVQQCVWEVVALAALNCGYAGTLVPSFLRFVLSYLRFQPLCLPNSTAEIMCITN